MNTITLVLINCVTIRVFLIWVGWYDNVIFFATIGLLWGLKRVWVKQLPLYTMVFWLAGIRVLFADWLVRWSPDVLIGWVIVDHLFRKSYFPEICWASIEFFYYVYPGLLMVCLIFLFYAKIQGFCLWCCHPLGAGIYWHSIAGWDNWNRPKPPCHFSSCRAYASMLASADFGRLAVGCASDWSWTWSGRRSAHCLGSSWKTTRYLFLFDVGAEFAKYDKGCENCL